MTDPVPFRHTDAGTGESRWLGDPRWALAPVLDVPALATAHDELLVFAAHPDDETLGAGGLVAMAARAGMPVRVVVVTDGEGSHPDASVWDPERLAPVRRGEAAAAVTALAPGAELRHLGLGDGSLADRRDELDTALAGLVRPRSLVVAPWSRDGHPDHDALGAAAGEVARRCGATLLQYPVWLWHWATPDELPWARAHVVELDRAAYDRRAAALREYGSQSAPLGPAPGDQPVLPRQVLRRASRPAELLLGDGRALPELPRVAGPDAFDAMYDGNEDPWGFHGSFYERRKRDLTVAVLPRERYGHVLEIGCATGVLTRHLAQRADRVTATDVSARALDLARREAPTHVTWVLGRVPEALPDDGPPEDVVDLAVLSEVGYFLRPTELLETLRRVRSALSSSGEVLLVHWRHATEDVPLDGPLVHEIAASVLEDLPHRLHLEDDDVVVDLWGGLPGSVAEREGRA
ncbi:bifunctional PIG-L family deacetylase/class I SAM-dependent methyltransferase [Phycicoccus sp. MAQZ13P-2]|uniref:bifunctional PIG-L family deacetylase/class I SAM-dependent methyltransferase n=1 Tax=Phycicoccus mangrovi TaxID=2840470 RepID=UPI001C0019E0|nr:bifunctional PIG-L family deacetylase/class I SAM-dependent methyltransferase [Phycicoccus mangrovi]MBT9256259.1 bifunctional PIG-L family deacetylase/class I SAM-dependent methyltransferase [Phycicoccus mangrovi]MBT9273726.1 bifunctional PIG-L family deacetylase/class I SAM-dependent methyltransferase [Phycicoccus mangrovi]